MFNLWIAAAADLAAIGILVFAVYFRRHFRRDLVLAYVSLNVGIMAVTMLLTGSSAGLGLGLGLFGILSIIRLRSDTLTQEEVAYYFMALAIGLVNGLHPDPAWFAPAVSAVLVLVMFLADHPRFASSTNRQTVTLDAAYPREQQLQAALATLLNAKVLRTVVLELDTVRDLTVVDVRFRRLPPIANPAPGTLPARLLLEQDRIRQ
jgi:hypothetical protein